LARALLSAIRTGRRDGAGFDDADAEEEDEVSGGLPSKRAVLRRIAKKRPGYLLTKGLGSFREQLTSTLGDDEEDDPLAPCCLKYFLSIFSPSNKGIMECDAREIRTLCEAIDGLLRGRQLETLDLLMQRLKAAMLATHDRSWQTARWLELLAPPKTAGVLDMEEEELVRKLEVGELKIQDVLKRLKDRDGGSSSSRAGR
jgi:hypothetical protein